MKSYIGIGLFVLVGLLTAIGIGFSSRFSGGPTAYDDEQRGLRQETVIKFSFVVAENTPKGLAAQRFARLVQEKTRGRVKVELFANGSLYNENDEVEALQRGNVQMIAPSFSNISEIVPAWMVMDLPFAFANDAAVDEAFKGDIGRILLQSLDKKQIVGLAFWGNGFRQMTSNKGPLVHPADFKGLRFRILPSKVIDAQFRAWGAKTFPIPFNQVYKNLEAGTVDGEENSISNIYSKKFYQVQKYITVSSHSYLGYGVLMNKTFWNKLPADLQNKIKEAMAETTEWANQNAVEMNRRQWEEIRSVPGLEIHILTPDERQEWRQSLDPIYQEFEPVIGNDLMKSVRELQKKYAGQWPAF